MPRRGIEQEASCQIEEVRNVFVVGCPGASIELASVPQRRVRRLER
jgi:hypothetical protein